MTEQNDLKIPASSMGQSMAVLAGVVAAYVGAIQPQGFSGNEEDLTVYHQAAISVFLYQLLIGSKQPEKMASILDAISIELRDPSAPSENQRPEGER